MDSSEVAPKAGVKTIVLGILFAITVALIVSKDTDDIYDFIAIPAIAGSLLGLVERSLQSRLPEERPVFHTVFNDLRIKHFSTIGIVSTFYSLIYGLLLGLFFSGLGYAFELVQLGLFGQTAILSLAFSFCCIVLLFLYRIIVESYVVIFKVAQKYLQQD
jgi:hypothetical protein